MWALYYVKTVYHVHFSSVLTEYLEITEEKTMTDNSSLLTVEQADVWTAARQPDNHNTDPVSTQMRRPYSTTMIVYSEQMGIVVLMNSLS